MGDTKISWADKSWNPVVGCSHVSPGCENCYAEAMAKRLAGRAGYAAPWKPWTASNAAHNVRLRPDVLEEPLHWRKPRRVFVCSMGDLFHDKVPDEFLDRVFGVMALAYEHTFLVLTKRPERMLAFCEAWTPQDLAPYPLPNVHLGVSVESQYWANIRLPVLMLIPAAARFISAEPLLGPIDVRRWLSFVCGHEPVSGNYTRCEICSEQAKGLSWVIIGAESGPRRRPMKMEWARDLITQCQETGTLCFVKQDSGRLPGQQGRFTDAEWALKQWPS